MDQISRYCLEQGDLEALALTALWTATGTWEPSRGTFSTVVTLSVRSALSGLCLDARRLKRGGAAAPAVSLDALLPGEEPRGLMNALTGAVSEMPERETVRRDTATRLWRAVDALPDKTRAVLMLHYADDLPLAEAGRRLGLSRQRVHQIMGRGLAELRGTCPQLDPRL